MISLILLQCTRAIRSVRFLEGEQQEKEVKQPSKSLKKCSRERSSLDEKPLDWWTLFWDGMLYG